MAKPPPDPSSVAEAGEEQRLHGLAGSVARGLSVEQSLARIAEAAREGARAEACYLERIDHAAGEVEVVATAGAAAPAVGERVPYPGSLAQEVVERGDVEVVAHEELRRRPIWRVLSLGAAADGVAVVAPLVSEGEALGALILLRRAAAPRLLEGERSRFRALADLAALALGRTLHGRSAADRALALEDSERRFLHIAENVREVFWVMDAATGRPLYLSPAYEAVWGHPAEDLMRGGDWLAYVHPDDRERVRAFNRKVVEEPAEIEHRIMRPDGEVRRVRVRGFPMKDLAGDHTRYGGVAEDVTEQKSFEERQVFLLEATRVLGSSLDFEETLRSLASLAVPRMADWCVVDVAEGETLRSLAVEHADPGKAAFARELARRYLAEPEGAIGAARVLRTGEAQLIREIGEEDLESVARDEEQLTVLRGLGLRSAMLVPMEARGRTLGVITFVAAESGRTYGADDLEVAWELAGRAALAMDNARLYAAAERRLREEAALREAARAVTATYSVEEVIRQIAVNAVLAAGADGAVVERIDPTASVLEVVASAGEMIVDIGTTVPYEGSLAQRAVETQEPIVLGRLRDAESTSLSALFERCGECPAIVLPLLDGGEVIGVLVLLRLPERGAFRQDEIDRAGIFANLAALAFRKIHLLEASEQRREELERALESRSRLIRGFTHDVKNPLGAAQGYLSLLEEGVVSDPEKREASVSNARRSIVFALGLIDDLVELARAEAGQVEVEMKPVDVREIAREISEEYRAQAEVKGLRVTCDLPEEFPVVESDPNRVRQILGNLVSNGIKYTDEGGVDVAVSLTPGEAGGSSWVTISVADTGPGIPEEKRHAVFHEFLRLHPATEGAGLGLAISRGVAEALGGSLTLDSTEGKGSTFVLWLPLERAG